MRRSLMIATFASLLSLSAGCGAPPEELEAAGLEATGEVAQPVTLGYGLSVSARWFYAYVGTPTYGSTPQPVLRVDVLVDDAAVRQQVSGFDGREQVFVLVPKRLNGNLVWERHALNWAGTRSVNGKTMDLHESPMITGVDGTTLQTHGVAVGLDTNVGTHWGQQSGQNWPVTQS
jgi:hypothetical protein